ncbi:tripartite tricarboxylate transporter substrate binding protein [Variovorax terrae]|uniref:Tripartite tricarboxylate transporter substrate binding protein n=1 Tax=Variovorax terrae TaxID=2923278 RepID=A0A9X2AQD0_9BURK|nr:tripartite tricarboxylate transporter substrate binding protein [Variovorax terrae]MCJ0764437.1 tripartite tricarboxylate transporter substrate binding protein [Variovorax terrae]
MSVYRKLTAIAALSLLAGAAMAQTYPSKPVRVVVPTVPGPLDVFARAVMEKVADRLKQPFIIDNKPGAGGNVGAEMVARAQPDGYTLLFAIDTTFTVNPALYKKKMPFDPEKDFATISVPVTYDQLMAVNPGVKANTVAELVALAKQRKLSYATGGNGSPSHLTMASFLSTAGIDMTHIPYKGTGQSVIDVVGGQVDSIFAVSTGVLPQVKGGKLRALAVSGTQRSAMAPEVPTVSESGFPGFSATFAYAVMAPAGTPNEIVQLLNQEIIRALATPDLQEKNRMSDYTAMAMTPQQSAAWLREMRKKWSDVITHTHITLD